MFTCLSKLQKSRGMLARNLYIESFINLFIINVTSIVSISFIFNDHVMHYYAHFYNVSERLTTLTTCRSTNDCESCLKHSKCTFHILSCMLTLGLQQIVLPFFLVDMKLSLQWLTAVDIYHQQDSILLCSYSH